ncbi:MAG: type II toxin-antitoxin system RatA family toxin [Burkholderiales bacterium]
MVHIERSALVLHPALLMHALVADIAAYPQFLPWCQGSESRRIAPDEVEATLQIEYRGVRQRFTTRNRTHPDHSIALALVDGPFKHLDGRWSFAPLRSDASKVHLVLNYQLASGLLEHVVGPMFSFIAGTLVDAFVRRADSLGNGKLDAG